MKRFFVFPIAMLLSPLAHAMCFFNQCDSVDVVDRHYDLDHAYYVKEPREADRLTDTQHYAVYRSGHYVGEHQPVFTFDLVNTHEVCCVKDDLLMTMLNVGTKVSLITSGGRKVSLCAHKPNYYWSSYQIRLLVKKTGDQTELSLSMPDSSVTCEAESGQFIKGLGVEDVTSVSLAGAFI